MKKKKKKKEIAGKTHVPPNLQTHNQQKIIPPSTYIYVCDPKAGNLGAVTPSQLYCTKYALLATPAPKNTVPSGAVTRIANAASP